MVFGRSWVVVLGGDKLWHKIKRVGSKGLW